MSESFTADGDEGESAFQRTVDGDIQMPSLIATDYMEIVILSIVLIVGIPLNGFVLYRLFKQYATERVVNRFKNHDARLRFLMLKMHLTLIDLAFIILYCPSKLIWLICYKWPFGVFLCKAVQFSWMFVHHSMSFAIVCIAIDRVKTVFDMIAMKKHGRLVNSDHRFSFAKGIIILSYICAGIFSIPQWFIWTTADLNSWSQCTTIWHKIRAEHFLSGSDVEYTFKGEQIYTIVHLITIFWGPIVILIISYTCIGIAIIFYATRQPLNSSIPPFKKSTAEAPRKNEMHQLVPPTKGIENEYDKVSSRGSLSEADGSGVSRGKISKWRLAFQSRICHTSAFVILAYLLCWLPYNFLALAMFFNKELSVSLSIHFDIVRVFVIFNALLNPFIYGFQKA